MKTQNTPQKWFELVRRGAIIFALLQPVQNLYAQNRPIKFERLSLEQGLSQSSVNCILQDRQGYMWFGTADGLNKYDGYNFTVYKHDALDSTSLSDNWVTSIYEDSASRSTLWIGTGGGLNRFDCATERFTHFVNDPKNPHSLSHNRALSIYEDSFSRRATGRNALWVGTENGLNRFNHNTEQFTRFFSDPKNPHSLSENAVQSIYEDHTGTLWIGTHGGLNKFDRDTEEFTRFVNDPKDPHSRSYNHVFCIYEASTARNTLWIGTVGGGLNKFDRETGQFTHYTEKDGLPNDAIYGILEDDNGHLWLSTNKGLSRFDPKTETFKNYDVTDGLQSNEFNSWAYCKSRSGEMFFGGINGFNAFHPDSIKDNPYLPPVVITAFKRYNTDETTEIAIEEKGISAKPAIELTYKDNFLWFEFAALSFRHPEKNRYAYK